MFRGPQPCHAGNRDRSYPSAVPVGPISLLCIHRTVADGRLHGIFSGIGVATADSVYAAVSFLGLTVVSGLILGYQSVFRSLAGLVLVLVGLRVFFSEPASVSTDSEHEPYLKDYLSMVAIAIANPLTLVFFIAILPGFGYIFQGTSVIAAAEFVAGSLHRFNDLVDRPVRLNRFRPLQYRQRESEADQPHLGAADRLLRCRDAHPAHRRPCHLSTLIPVYTQS